MTTTTDTDPGHAMVFTFTAWTTDLITIVISLIFLYHFAQTKEKAYGLYMILVLNLSGWMFPIMDIVVMVVPQSHTSAYIFGCLKTGIYHFGLYWSTAIAIFIYKTIFQKKNIYPKSYMISTCIYCLILSTATPIMFSSNAWGTSIVFDDANKSIKFSYPLTGLYNQVMYFLVCDIIAALFPILITSYCYYKVAQSLTTSYGLPVFESKFSPSRMLWFIVIQITCFVPGIVADAYFMSQGTKYAIFPAFVVSFMHRTWGFLNLWAYWFIDPNSSKRRRRSSSEDSTDSTEDRTESLFATDMAILGTNL